MFQSQIYGRIEGNKDEKKRKCKFLQENEALYIIPNDFQKHGENRKEILKIKFP